jgi:hypothetical protein
MSELLSRVWVWEACSLLMRSGGIELSEVLVLRGLRAPGSVLLSAME